METIYLKILRWAFSQLFGTKAKKQFDTTIEPLIINYVKDNSSLNASELILLLHSNGTYDDILNSIIKNVKIPSEYKSIITMLLDSWITDSINKLIKK